MKMAFWVTYDHLGKLVLLNALLWLGVACPIAFAYNALTSGDPVVAVLLGLPLLLLALGVVLPVGGAGLAWLAKELIETRDGSLGTFFAGARRFAGAATRLGLMYVGIGVCLGTSVWFYAVRVGASLPWLGYGLSALALWGLVFLGLTALFVLPALVQKGSGAWAAIRLSAALVVDNPLFCIGLAVQFGLLALCALAPPVAMFIAMAAAVVLSSSAYEMLSRNYAAHEGRPPVNDNDDDYLNRGVRDLLFPWKS